MWQKYSNASGIEFACFVFHVSLLFCINFSSFKSDTENHANFDAVASKRGDFDAVRQRRQNFDQNPYECKGYNARKFITKFSDKGWTKKSINRLLVKMRKFGTVDVLAGSVMRNFRHFW